MGFHSVSPLLLLNNPDDVWRNQPSFLIIEVTFFALLAHCTLHAWQLGGPHAMRWFACLFGGSAIELLSILERENIGNFYHSQAVVMLFGGREPAYMLFGCYVWIQYVSVALPALMGLRSALVEAMLSGLLCSFIWGLLDLVGLRHLWWTWHNTEPLYVDRHFGVPVASTFWITSSTASLSLVLRLITNKICDKPRGIVPLLLGLFAGPLAAVVVMNVPFMAIYHPLVTMSGFHASVAMLAARAAAVCFSVLFIFTKASPRVCAPSKHAVHLFCQVVFLFIAALAGIVWFWGPRSTQIVRTSFSQPFGRNSSAMEASFWGAFQRSSFVTPNSVDGLRDCYSFDCVSEPGVRMHEPPAALDVMESDSSWYTVCGTATPEGWMFEFWWLISCVVVLTVVCVFVWCGDSSDSTTQAKTKAKKKQS